MQPIFVFGTLGNELNVDISVAKSWISHVSITRFGNVKARKSGGHSENEKGQCTTTRRIFRKAKGSLRIYIQREVFSWLDHSLSHDLDGQINDFDLPWRCWWSIGGASRCRGTWQMCQLETSIRRDEEGKEIRARLPLVMLLKAATTGLFMVD